MFPLWAATIKNVFPNLSVESIFKLWWLENSSPIFENINKLKNKNNITKKIK
jgi:hypothetical protein